jgi:uncharacterized caspase-like protein
VGPKGTLWFIFIGHGAPNKTGTDGLLLGVDTDGDGDSLSARGVAQERVLSLVGQGKQAHSVVVFDACFSGKTVDGTAPLVKGLMATLPNRSTSASATATVLAASDSFAGPLPNADRPAFSYLLLGALRGWADDNGDKAIDVDEAHEFTRSYMGKAPRSSTRFMATLQSRAPPRYGQFQNRTRELSAIARISRKLYVEPSVQEETKALVKGQPHML